uniref:PH domain-containing protein n=1 Tax=Phaeomonas parva TaxID=124430 RepID=A0A6U4KSE8_9STRA|mmetsp:Transcript_45775/g.143186  ORF Transcript_45775/g.143186 Transcript_45775/m.143186 type:complete len:158 (+) Transcript_45775:341-814(+)
MRTTGTVRSESTEAYVPMTEDVVHIQGYLHKRTKDMRWQKRWFETNGCFLTYYKSRKMDKILAALNLPQVGEIKLLPESAADPDNDGTLFTIELKARVYTLRAPNRKNAAKWVEVLNELKTSGNVEISSNDKARVASAPLDDQADWSKTPFLFFCCC